MVRRKFGMTTRGKTMQVAVAMAMAMAVAMQAAELDSLTPTIPTSSEFVRFVR